MNPPRVIWSAKKRLSIFGERQVILLVLPYSERQNDGIGIIKLEPNFPCSILSILPHLPITSLFISWANPLHRGPGYPRYTVSCSYPQVSLEYEAPPAGVERYLFIRLLFAVPRGCPRFSFICPSCGQSLSVMQRLFRVIGIQKLRLRFYKKKSPHLVNSGSIFFWKNFKAPDHDTLKA